VAESPIKPSESAEVLSLSRWSRLKREQRATVSPPLGLERLEERVLEQRDMPLAAIPSPQPSPPGGGGSDALPSLSSISLTEDFTPFMQAKVPQLLKQQALKALFKDPHFNAMDGLDTYIDDYTVFEPISAEDMGKLSAWKSIQNPLRQVVTPGGYAVDVESEEGMAVLAEQARVEALNSEADLQRAATVSSRNASEIDRVLEIESQADQRSPSIAARERVPDRAGEGDRLASDDGQAKDALSHDGDTQFTALTPTLSRAAGEGANATVAMSPPVAASPAPHPRYGKRVSDFTFIEATPEIQDGVADESNKNTSEKPQ
jgi:Protein of unknown function (DUF3306)